MDNPNDNSQSFDRFSGIVRRRGWLALGIFLLGLALTLTFVWSLPPLYQASASLVVVDSSPPGYGAAANSALSNPPPLDAVTQQVLGRSNLAKIISRHNLYPAVGKGTSAKGLAGRLRKNVSIKKDQMRVRGGVNQTLGFTINYNDKSPETAAAVANDLAKSYQDTARNIRLQQARKKAASLSASMAVVSTKLGKQKAKIEQFNRKHLGALPQQQQVTLTSLNHLYAQLRADRTGELNAINQRADLLGRMSNNDNNTDTGNLSLAQLKQKLHNLKLRYTDQYPDVVNVKRQIAAMEKQQASGGSSRDQASPLQSQLNDINLELQQFKANEKKVQAQIENVQAQLASIPITGQSLETLNHNAQQTNEVYTTLLKQYEQARVVAATADKGAPPYTITEPALVPTSSEGPKRLRYAVMLVILCAILAFVILVIAEKRDTSFHTLDEVRRFTKVPILATIPVIRRRRDGFARFSKAGIAVVVIVCGMAVLAGIGYTAGHGNHSITQALSSKSK